MKVTNKTEAHVKYAGVLFAPKETKEIQTDKIYKHEDFVIEEEQLKKPEKIEKKKEKKTKRKGGKK